MLVNYLLVEICIPLSYALCEPIKYQPSLFCLELFFKDLGT